MNLHDDLLKGNPRMKFPINNVAEMRTRLQELAKIREQAHKLRRKWGVSAESH